MVCRHAPVRSGQLLLGHPAKSQDMLASTRTRIRQTTILRLRGNGDVVLLGLVRGQAKVSMECPTHRLLGGILTVKDSLLVVQAPGTASDTLQDPKGLLVRLARA